MGAAQRWLAVDLDYRGLWLTGIDPSAEVTSDMSRIVHVASLEHGPDKKHDAGRKDAGD